MDEKIAALLEQATSRGKQGRLPEALELFRQVLSLDPHNFDALHGMGIGLSQTGKFDEALSFIARASAIQPDNFLAHYNLGLVLIRLERYPQAVTSLDRAISLKPDHAEAHLNRGIALQNHHRHEEALDNYNKAIALCPDSVQAFLHRGNVCTDLNRHEDALASYDQVIGLRPDLAVAYFNRGNVLRDLKRHQDALASYDRAIALRPDYAKAIYNKSLLHLLLGNYELGWPLHEWRWQDRPVKNKHFKQPLWLGEQSPAGKTILLHWEQGLGDVIQFIRYAPLVSALGASVILEVPPSLVSLLRTLKGTYTLITHGDTYPDFDLHCPLMSLPLAFKTTLATIPANASYLRADPHQALGWSQRLKDFHGLKVGLVWAGGIRPDQPMAMAIDARRSLYLSSFAPLSQVPGVHFFSLQKGPPSSQLAELRRDNWSGPEIADYTDELHDWADTAALVDNLDLVISCDTSTAHLAAAMGKPTWILNRYDTCWRWLLDREDSPWYSSARLFRQERPGEWASVVERIRTALLTRRKNGWPPTPATGK